MKENSGENGWQDGKTAPQTGELAAGLGVHWTTISRWRNGREPIPKTVELALKWLEGEGRIDAIGQNGEGEHYQSPENPV